MISSTKYLRPNVTIETEYIGTNKFYVYNCQGRHYRVFASLVALNLFLNKAQSTWDFDCDTESELETFLNTTQR